MPMTKRSNSGTPEASAWASQDRKFSAFLEYLPELLCQAFNVGNLRLTRRKRSNPGLLVGCPFRCWFGRFCCK